MTRRLLLAIVTPLLVILLAGCNSQVAEDVAPVERQQIQNVVDEFVTRDTNIPDYEVEIEEVTENWARVSINPVRTEDGESLLYLQKQTETVSEAPTVAATVQPGHEARVEARTGWTIILGPQADFTPAELDEVGVPPEIRQ